MRKFFSIFSWTVVLFIVLLLCALCIVPRFGISAYSYGENSVIYVKPISEYSELEQGVIITYTLDSEESISANAIYAVDTQKQYCFIKSSDLSLDSGSNNDSAVLIDGVPVVPIDFDSIIGITVLTVPYVGYVSDFITTENGFLLITLFSGIFLGIAIIARLSLNRPDEEIEDSRGKQRKKKRRIDADSDACDDEPQPDGAIAANHNNTGEKAATDSQKKD